MCRRSETLLTKKYKKSLATGHDVEKSVLNKEVISEYNSSTTFEEKYEASFEDVLQKNQSDDSHKSAHVEQKQEDCSSLCTKKSLNCTIDEDKYICDICDEKFMTFFDYQDHHSTHNGQFLFTCEKCTQVFRNRGDLLDHESKHKISCHICSLQVLPKSMSAHLLIHTDIYRCAECGMRHTSSASLEKHTKARHSTIRGFLCHICGKQSSCQSSMNRHMGYHKEERPFKCKYCEFSAKSVNIVQVHTSRRHFAEKTVCEVCAKVFKSQMSLVQHMKRIHREKKFVCNVCSKAFIERYNLNKHMKRHTSQRLHECKICHKEFFTVRELKAHMHTHRQGCVDCPKCGKRFFYKKYLQKHVNKCGTDYVSVVT
jgi:KRAB domain-containing zinc finger protein